MSTQSYTMSNAPYLINEENGRHFPNMPGFAQIKGMRPITHDEAVDRGLPVPDELTTTTQSMLEIPPGVNTIARLNRFAIDSGLVSSLNPSKGFEALLHEVKIMVAQRNKEVVDATTYAPELPEGFYAKTVQELNTFINEQGLEVDTKGKKKSQIQAEIAKAVSARDFALSTIDAESNTVTLQTIKGG